MCRDSVCFHRNPDSGSRDSVCRDSACRDSVCRHSVCRDSVDKPLKYFHQLAKNMPDVTFASELGHFPSNFDVFFFFETNQMVVITKLYTQFFL